MSTLGTDLHFFLNGVGSSTLRSSLLPVQTVPDSEKKKEDFKKRTMDSLESIGLRQLADNYKFRDYYKMMTGDLVYADYGIEDDAVLSEVRRLGDGVGIPSRIKHYDIMGILFRKLIGEWSKQKENFKVNSTADEISENDFLNELTQKSNEFTIQMFNKNIEKFLYEKGLHPAIQNFQSEEEQQQFLQRLEEEKAKIIPPEQIQAELSKNFKTKASEWAEHTMDNDQRRFHLDKTDKQEMMDFLLTGRYFRHYYVGYDNYKPETWSPLDTFFSRDLNAEYPQDGEYIGRIQYLSAADIIKRYGHLLKPDEIKRLTRKFGGSADNNGVVSKNELFFGQTQHVPFKNYYDYELGLQIQDAVGTPMGETIINTTEGLQTIPSWLTPFQNRNTLGFAFTKDRRSDFAVRTDVLQVTQAYFRSFKRMWLLIYKDENGISSPVTVTDELLSDFIKEKNIKKITTKTLQDIRDGELEDDSMYEFWIPEIWQGIKINAGNSGLGQNLYLDFKPLDYQIKGDSNIYDVKLPVGGFIGDSIAKRLRPYQIGYNICLNQIFNLLAKEMGMFFLFDINFLPSDYKNDEQIEESLEKIQTLAKEIGIVPIDSSKQNIQNAQNMNTFSVQNVTFENQINSRINMASFYFSKLMEQIGFTPQRLGQATTYETATGVQQGVEATYDQTVELFTDMSTARLKCMELHLSVAQYCQKEYLDKDFIFTSSYNDKTYINLSDPDFPLRKLGLLPSNSPNERLILEKARNYLIQTNTLGNDFLDAVSIFTSDTLVELASVAKKSRIEKNKQEQAQKDHEKELLDRQLASQENQIREERIFKATQSDKDRETKLEVERISALGRASDKKSDLEGIDAINEAAKEAITNNFKDRELAVKETLANNKIENESKKIEQNADLIRIQQQMLELKNKAIETSKINSLRNSIDKNINN